MFKNLSFEQFLKFSADLAFICDIISGKWYYFIFNHKLIVIPFITNESD